MKLTRDQVSANDTRAPALRFTEEASISRFGGLPVLRSLYELLSLRRHLDEAVSESVDAQLPYSRGGVLLLLITMLMLGYRRLADVQWLKNDVLIQRLLAWKQLPSKATLSRTMSSMTAQTVERLQLLSTRLVLDSLRLLQPVAMTMDFDGSVQSTKGHAEGTAVGFNKKKKGARSYMPLFATVDGHGFGFIFGMLHRAGNVHDSAGAEQFIEQQLATVKDALPDTEIDTRIDAAFFDHKLLGRLHDLGVVFTCSVPFNRFAALKERVQSYTAWETADGAHAGEHTAWSYAEGNFQPKTWAKAGRAFRFILVRQRKAKQLKGPVQLDLFEPRDMEYDYSVIVTNDRDNAAASVVEHHHGRGRQEKMFGDAKQDCSLGHIACHTLHANKTYTILGMIAYNLGRALERHVPVEETESPARRLQTLRRRLLELPARLTFPQRRATLTIHASLPAQAAIEATIESISRAA